MPHNPAGFGQLELPLSSWWRIMAARFPLLKGQDRPFFPGKGQGCLVCGKPYQGRGFAYLGAGASCDFDECGIDERALGAFFHVGFHGKNADMSDSGGVEVVKDLDGGQFDLQFCSTACLRQFFSTIVDEVEKSISRQKPLDGVEDAE
jgi:hypothetical protein